MVGEVDEDVVVSGGVQGLSVSSIDGGIITSQQSQEVLGGDVATGVIDLTTFIDFPTFIIGGLVVKLSLEGVGCAGGNIVVGEGDDSVGGVTILSQDLVCVTNIGLVSVIPESVGSGDQHGPVVG